MKGVRVFLECFNWLNQTNCFLEIQVQLRERGRSLAFGLSLGFAGFRIEEKKYYKFYNFERKEKLATRTLNYKVGNFSFSHES